MSWRLRAETWVDGAMTEIRETELSELTLVNNVIHEDLNVLYYEHRDQPDRRLKRVYVVETQKKLKSNATA